MTGGLHTLRTRAGEWAAAASADAQLRAFAVTTDLVLGLDDGAGAGGSAGAGTSAGVSAGAYVDAAADAAGAGGGMLRVRVTPDGVELTDADPAVTLVAPPAAWASLLSRSPAPTMNHFLALTMRIEGARIEGDELRFAQQAHVIRRLLELARGVVDAEVPRAADVGLDRHRIRGRYVPVVVDGHEIDLYVEEAGDGPPLLVLHTAGADARQAHPLLADASLGRRVVAFDMPGHGRSDAVPGPLGSWTLTADRYVDAVSGVIAALGLDAPVVVGASMAGQACLLLAARVPDLLGGVIACEASDHVPGRVTPWAGDSRVNEALFVPEWVEGLIGPSAPSDMHDLIWRSYSQGGHRTFAGDIDFYSGGGWDGRQLVTRIDTARCPVVMMTGEYDYSCLPSMSEATAARIEGAHYWTMPGLGHFPIVENPEAFRPHLVEALTLIGRTA